MQSAVKFAAANMSHPTVHLTDEGIKELQARCQLSDRYLGTLRGPAKVLATRVDGHKLLKFMGLAARYSVPPTSIKQ